MGLWEERKGVCCLYLLAHWRLHRAHALGWGGVSVWVWRTPGLAQDLRRWGRGRGGWQGWV